MRSKLAIQCIFGTGYIINATRIQSSKIRQLGLRWMQTNPSSKQQPKGYSRSLWNDMFGKYLLTTNILSSGILMVAGDILSQEIEYRRGVSADRHYDWFRIGRMFLVGSIQGPLHHYFYKWMDDAMPVPTTKTTTWKILLDQFVMSPVCIFLFFYPACLLENKTFSESTDELRRKFLTVYTVDWIVWPAAQFINFQYLHPKYRVIYVNLVTMLYNIFLSYVKHHEVDYLNVNDEKQRSL